MKKLPSKRMKNHIRTYLNDEEHLALIRRMNEECITGVSTYVRKLIIADSQQSKEQ